MPKQAWNIFIGFLALLIIGFLGFNAWQYRQQLDKAKADLEVESQRADQSQTDGSASVARLKSDVVTLEQNLKQTQEIAEKLGAARSTLEASNSALKAANSGLESSKSALEMANNRLSAENMKLRTQVQEATELKTRLETDLKSKLASKDVTISQLEGKLSVDILNKVLFDLGQAELKEEGKKILQDVATAMENYPNRPIHVIGHTDNIPFKSGGGRFRSNWELSAGRAVAAVQFLQATAGIDPARLAAVGHSEYHPIASNETEDGQAQNRRITLVIMPEELQVLEPPAPEPKPEPKAEPAPVKTGEPAPSPAKTGAEPKAPAIIPPAGAVITGPAKAAPVAGKATPAPKPITISTNLALPPRSAPTNSAPELPKIPALKARPESTVPPKG